MIKATIVGKKYRYQGELVTIVCRLKDAPGRSLMIRLVTNGRECIETRTKRFRNMAEPI